MFRCDKIKLQAYQHRLRCLPPFQCCVWCSSWATGCHYGGLHEPHLSAPCETKHTQTHTKTKTVGNTVNTSRSMSSAHFDHLNWKLKGGLRKPWHMDIDSGKSKKGWHQIIKKRHSLVKLKYLPYNVFLNNPARQLTKVYFWSSPCFHDKVTSTPNRQINKCVKTLE